MIIMNEINQQHLSSVTRNPENLDILYYISLGNIDLSVNY